MSKIENRLERLKNSERVNNVILQGKKLNTYNEEDLTKTNLEEALDIKAEINSTAKLGEKMCLIKLPN